VKPLKRSVVVELIKISNISCTKFTRKYGRLTFRFSTDLMVITDNETRWNSVFYSIRRGIKLLIKIILFFINYINELSLNLFTLID
jgi:hypothetical protein